jgi:hypothetical protein
MIELEDETKMSIPGLRLPARAKLAQILSFIEYLSRGGRIQEAQYMEQGTLACPRRTHYNKPLPFCHLQGNAIKDP